MTSITLHDQIYEFKNDLSIRELDALGDEPLASDPKAVNVYNRKRLCAFSLHPKLSLDDLLDMPSLDYITLVNAILGEYGKKMIAIVTKVTDKPSPTEIVS